MKLLQSYHPQGTIFNLDTIGDHYGSVNSINYSYKKQKLCDSKEVIEGQTESMENVHLGVVLKNAAEELEIIHPHVEE